MKDPTGQASARKVLLVLLDGQRNTLGSLQSVDIAAIRTAYANGGGGVNAVGNADWRALLERLMAARGGAASVQMPVALLTLDHASANPLTAEQIAIAANLNISPADLAQRYGQRRLDWRPFVGGETIETYLDQSREEVNRWLRDPQAAAADSMTWEYGDEARFWADVDYVRQFAGLMEAGQPGLIIIDPLVATHPSVQKRLRLFERCLRFGHVAIVTLHPAIASPQEMNFRRWVAENTLTLLEAYDSPRPIPDLCVTARTAIVANNIIEMQRVIKTSIGDRNRRRAADGVPVAAAIRN